MNTRCPITKLWSIEMEGQDKSLKYPKINKSLYYAMPLSEDELSCALPTHWKGIKFPTNEDEIEQWRLERRRNYPSGRSRSIEKSTKPDIKKQLAKSKKSLVQKLIEPQVKRDCKMLFEIFQYFSDQQSL